MSRRVAATFGLLLLLLLMMMMLLLLQHVDLGSSSSRRAAFVLALVIRAVGGRGGRKEAVGVRMLRESGRSFDAAVVVDYAGITARISKLRLSGLSDGTEAAGTLA